MNHSVNRSCCVPTMCQILFSEQGYCRKKNRLNSALVEWIVLCEERIQKCPQHAKHAGQFQQIRPKALQLLNSKIFGISALVPQTITVILLLELQFHSSNTEAFKIASV